MYVCIYMYVCMYVCMYNAIYVHSHITGSLQYLYDINYLWYGPIGLVLCLVVGMMASLPLLCKKCGWKQVQHLLCFNVLSKEGKNLVVPNVAWKLFLYSGCKVWRGENVTPISPELMFTWRGCLPSDSNYGEGDKKYQQEKDTCTKDPLLDPNGRFWFGPFLDPTMMHSRNVLHFFLFPFRVFIAYPALRVKAPLSKKRSQSYLLNKITVPFFGDLYSSRQFSCTRTCGETVLWRSSVTEWLLGPGASMRRTQI